MAGRGRLAKQVRTRLELVGEEKLNQDPLEEVSFGKPVHQHVKEFGIIFGIIALIVAGVVAYKGGPYPWLLGSVLTSAVLVFLGYTAPKVLYPLWKAWMAIAMFLGTIMTTIILSIAWILMLVPIAFLLKIIGKKVMDLSYEPSKESYWETREEKYKSFKLLERQF